MIENARLRIRVGAVLLASALVVVALESRRRSMAPEPSLSTDGVKTVESLRLSAPVGDVTVTPGELTWEAVAGATRYQVVLMEVDRSELWSQSVAASRVTIPASLRIRIVSRKTLLWRVTAYGGNGAVLLESEVGRFRVEPGA